MIRKIKLITALVYLLILVLSFPFVTSVYIDYDDNWTVNEGDGNDGVAWGGYYLDIGLNSLTSNADIVCWDWDDDSEYSHCYFETGVSEYECDDDYLIKSEPNGDYVNLSSLYDGHCSLGDGGCDHEIDTGSSGQSWSEYRDTIYFEDCDSVASYTNVDAKKYWIIYGHQYDCDSEPGPSTDPDYEGNYDSWLNIKANTSKCSASQECDENHDAIVSCTASATPSDPCRTKNWYSCSDDDDCISDKCEQSECSTCSDSQCTSAYWNSCTNNGALCCAGDAVPDQYYCEYYETWTDCTSESHTGCQQKGSYYCTLESGDWKWRTCTFGCNDSSCTEPDIDVYPTTLTFNINQTG